RPSSTRASSTGAAPRPFARDCGCSDPTPRPWKSRCGVAWTSTPPRTGSGPRSCGACSPRRRGREPRLCGLARRAGRGGLGRASAHPPRGPRADPPVAQRPARGAATGRAPLAGRPGPLLGRGGGSEPFRATPSPDPCRCAAGPHARRLRRAGAHRLGKRPGRSLLPRAGRNRRRHPPIFGPVRGLSGGAEAARLRRTRLSQTVHRDLRFASPPCGGAGGGGIRARRADDRPRPDRRALRGLAAPRLRERQGLMRFSNERVFVSGGAGVIGDTLVRALNAEGATILVGDLKPRPAEWPGGIIYRQGDLNDMRPWELQAFGPTIVFHLAATFERSVESLEFWDENFRHNLALSHHLGGLMRDCPSLRRVVFASSYLVYDPETYIFDHPQNAPVRLSEDHRIQPRNLCGGAKLIHELELAFLGHFEQTRFTAAAARIFRSYGRGSRDVISRWVRASLAGQPIEVFN